MFDLDRTCDLFACFDARGRWDSLVAKDLCESGKFEMDTSNCDLKSANEYMGAHNTPPLSFNSHLLLPQDLNFLSPLTFYAIVDHSFLLI
jgi:hypothetical protein